MRTSTLMINEVFYSIQGESTRAGLPCVFVRLMGCPLRCNYCDTEYAFYEGRRRTLEDLVAEVERIGGGCGLVEVTGGEPLLQPKVHDLMRRLCEAGHTVLVETSGACDIASCDPRVIRIMDLKTPGSGERARNRWENLQHLTPRDEIKFVITSRGDYEWARELIQRERLHERAGAILLSPAAEMAAGGEVAGTEGLLLHDLAQWILDDHLPVRVQTQLHKLIWDPAARGV